jgi:cytochrome c oxidase subunit III
VSSAAILPPPPTALDAPVATAEGGGPPRSTIAQTGVWIGIATISMSFAALTSALVVRQSSGSDWQHIQWPALLYVNTLVLLASSLTLEVARRRHATAFGLHATVVLGVLFVIGQVLAWRQLAARGVFLASGPSSAFFYVFTALHALHVLGGLGGLGYVERRLATANLSPSTLTAAALYWHFMAILWLYLLALLTIRG